jgi:hypothetical protein
MDHHYSTVFSNQQGISAQVCPRGVIVLSIGHTSLTLRKADFLRLAQVVRGATSRHCGQQTAGREEQRH